MYQSSEWSSCWLIASQTLLVAFFAIYLTFFYLGNIYSLSAHLKDIAWMNCSEAELPWAKQSQGWPSQVLGGTLVSSESSGDRIGSHQGRNNFSQVQLSSIWGRVVITLNEIALSRHWTSFEGRRRMVNKAASQEGCSYTSPDIGHKKHQAMQLMCLSLRSKTHEWVSQKSLIHQPSFIEIHHH